MRHLLWPLAVLYTLIVAFRNLLYNFGILKAHKVGIPVISVGNLTAGGTGKTPFVQKMIEFCLENDLKLAVITRGYKRESELDWEKIDSLDPKKYGDEPSLTHLKFPKVDIYVGSDRVQIAKEVLKKNSYDLFLLDDAFQHRRIYRDLDIVLLDATAPLWHYYPLPVGRARETGLSLSRAHWIVKTKTKDKASDESRILHFHYHLNALRELKDFHRAESKDLRSLKNKEVVLLSAIARPEIFEAQIRDLGIYVKKHFHFKDHYSFQDSDILRVKNFAATNPVLCTEKDAVKLQALTSIPDTFYVVELQTSLSGSSNELFEQILQFKKTYEKNT